MALLAEQYPTRPIRKIGVRTFIEANRSDVRYHSQPGGCAYSLNTLLKMGINPRIWEQEVWEDAEGQHWYATPGADQKTLGDWGTCQPCGQCEKDYIDDLLAIAPWLDKDTSPACHGRWEEADFMTSDWQNDDAVKAAIAICEGCPIQQPCLDWAREVHTRYDLIGTYGGEVTSQRRKHIANLNA